VRREHLDIGGVEPERRKTVTGFVRRQAAASS
jgi:hypothetical protein